MHAVGGDMAVSFVGLFALAGLAALVFLAVLGLITLLTNPKTRDVAKILLGGLAALVLLVVLVGGLFLGVSRQHVVAQREIARREVTAARLKALGEQLHKESAAVTEADDAYAAAVEETAPEAADDTTPATAATEDTTPTPAATDVELPPDPRDRETEEEAEASDSKSTDREEETVSEPVDSILDESLKEEAPESVEVTAATPEEPEESDVGELSVAPLPDHSRPPWVDRQPYKEGSVYYWPVAADPRPDADRAEFEALPKALNEAVADYITQKLRLGSLAGRQVRLEPAYLRDQLVGEDVWLEPRSSSVGEFFRMHALVKFDRDANTMIREAWGHQKKVGRLWSAGGFLSIALLFLSLVYCYLKIDQVTNGSRRVLLRFAAILVILGLMLIAAGVASVGIA